MKLALPWTLFAGMILGLGNNAWEVTGLTSSRLGRLLGWDPVENSSLVPWIIIVAAIHTMLAEEKTSGYKKSSLILCIMAFVMVLYSTFLTRQGNSVIHLCTRLWIRDRKYICFLLYFFHYSDLAELV
ncbi:MAG: cytochrome c biogenesis protein CcsA [Ignavibacteria bacterium]|nr:cytochrome c biogenesis protein CcsA [Ignavibacteria bacterium]